MYPAEHGVLDGDADGHYLWQDDRIEIHQGNAAWDLVAAHEYGHAVMAAAFADLPVPPVPYTLSDMARDAVGLLDHLGIDRAHVVGASMGGMIAQHIAIEVGPGLAVACGLNRSRH